MAKAISIFVAVVLTGCAGFGCAQAEPFTVHVIPQNDAPVQIVSIAPHGDNPLGHMVVKNMTDKPVLGFDIAWVIIIPKNCSSDRRGQVIRPVQASQSAHVERSTGVLAPHEETGQITTLSTLKRDSLAKMAKVAGARRIRVQVGIGSVDYAPPEALTGAGFTHVGPDWREPRFEQFPSPDPDDAEQQACAGASAAVSRERGFGSVNVAYYDAFARPD